MPVSFPPAGQWFQVGVGYHDNHGQQYDVHPRVKIFCNGALASQPERFPDPARLSGLELWAVAAGHHVAQQAGSTGRGIELASWWHLRCSLQGRR